MIYSACTRLYFYVCFYYALIRFWVPFCIHISRLAANNNNVSNDRSAHRHTQSILLFLVHCTSLLFLDGIFLSDLFLVSFAIFKSFSTNTIVHFCSNTNTEHIGSFKFNESQWQKEEMDTKKYNKNEIMQFSFNNSSFWYRACSRYNTHLKRNSHFFFSLRRKNSVDSFYAHVSSKNSMENSTENCFLQQRNKEEWDGKKIKWKRNTLFDTMDRLYVFFIHNLDAVSWVCNN